MNKYGICAKDSKTYGGSKGPYSHTSAAKKGYRNAMQTDIARSKCITYHLVEVGPGPLCRWGYSKALGYAFRLAVATVRYRMRPRFPLAILDGINDHMVPLHKCYPKADKNWPVVSLASCIAKTRQLQRMNEAHEKFPEYGFVSHAGYGVPRHVDRIKQFGAIPGFHRMPIIANMFRRKGLILPVRKLD